MISGYNPASSSPFCRIAKGDRRFLRRPEGRATGRGPSRCKSAAKSRIFHVILRNPGKPVVACACLAGGGWSSHPGTGRTRPVGPPSGTVRGTPGDIRPTPADGRAKARRDTSQSEGTMSITIENSFVQQYVSEVQDRKSVV